MDKSTGTLVKQFFSQYKAREYQKGEIILRAKETPTSIYYLETGYVREFILSEQGLELTLHFFKPKSFFPLTWALLGHENLYDFDAATPVIIRQAPKDEVVVFLKNNVEVLFDLNKRVLAGIEGLLSRIQYLAFGNARLKVVSTLLFLTKHFSEVRNDVMVITTPFTHREIAAFAGVTRETVSREIEKLKEQQLIRYNAKTIALLDIMALRQELSTSVVKFT